MAATIMFQGTGSDVGKSVLTAALCRILAQDGYNVAPFKSQNMALNSFITKKGKEIGRAQAVQAEAAMIEPTVDMNPILLKPNADNNSQVIYCGKAYKNMTAKEYFSSSHTAYKLIKKSFDKLSSKYQVIVIEGAGSPAEINLRENDFVNMRIAAMADAPVILIADIDKGGVFASIVGTLELLSSDEIKRIKGIIINKFRGDIERFKTGIKFIEEYTHKPVLGIIPYIEGVNIPDEDSISKINSGESDPEIDIAVIRLPHISNFTDFDYFIHEPGVSLRYVREKEKLKNPDLIIIPGTKNTIGDLKYLYRKGFAKKIKNLFEGDVPIVGICGGLQILGKTIEDPEQIEIVGGKIEGFGLLDIKSTFDSEKITTQIRAKDRGNLPFSRKLNDGCLTGYEIHQGRTKHGSDVNRLFDIQRENSDKKIIDGVISNNSLVWGTYIHDIFKNDNFRRELINYLRVKKGLNRLKDCKMFAVEEREKNYNKFAKLVKSNIDMERIYDIMGL